MPSDEKPPEQTTLAAEVTRVIAETERDIAERHRMERNWQPSPKLRFRELGGGGMLLEQFFLGTSFSEPTIGEWRPVPVVPESEGVQQ